MRLLITGDLHLEDHPDADYRFQVFDWLERGAAHYDVNAVLILGDLTMAKDRHSAVLVNRIAKEMRYLSKVVPLVTLMGNHDYIDPLTPFFGFLHGYAGTYVSEPSVRSIQKEGEFLFVPHLRSWESRTTFRRAIDLDVGYDAIFTHQTFRGAVASNGQEMGGVPLSTVSKKNTAGTRVFSGDIHVPQKIGNVTYAGAPYPIAFGDFPEGAPAPSFLLWEDGAVKRLPRHSIKKRIYTVSDVDQIPFDDLDTGDFLRVRLQLQRNNLTDWRESKAFVEKESEERGLRLRGFAVETPAVARGKAPSDLGKKSPKQVFSSYTLARRLSPRISKAGKKYL